MTATVEWVIQTSWHYIAHAQVSQSEMAHICKAFRRRDGLTQNDSSFNPRLNYFQYLAMGLSHGVIIIKDAVCGATLKSLHLHNPSIRGAIWRWSTA